MENKGNSKLKTSGQASLNYFISPISTRIDRENVKALTISTYHKRNEYLFDNKSFEFVRGLFFVNLSKINFEDTHILIYQKGHQDAHVYQKVSKSIKIKAESFHAIYSSVKRSKVKTFESKKFQANSFQGSGPIIANEFDYLSCQIILLTSRPEFFPPLQSEKNQFKIICQNAYCSLIKTFLVELNNERLKIIKMAITSNAEPFKITTKMGEVWLEKNHTQQEGTNSTLFYLKESHILTIFNKSLSKVNPTLFHYERISLLGELLNTLRHELSNPLFGIQLYLTLWIDSTNNIEQKELLQHALKCVYKCNGIILNLDSLFKNNSPLEELDIKKFLDDILTVAKSEIRNIPTRIIIDESPSCILNAHGLSLFHIVFNFLINAAQSIKQSIKPATNHEILITVVHKKHKLIINVSDTGIGINKCDLNKITTPFYSTKATGHGIGLNICTMLAEKIGGKISFTNRDDHQGAIFTLDLNL